MQLKLCKEDYFWFSIQICILFTKNINEKYYFIFLKFQFKMEPLATTKQVLIWLSMHPDRPGSSNIGKKVTRFLLPCILFLLFLFMSLSIGCFTVKYFETRLEDCLFSFMGAVNCFGSFNSIVIAFFTRHQIPILFEKLSAIYGESEY